MRQSAATPLLNGVLYMLVITVLSTVGYTVAGWSLGDSFYMVIITIFTVGYGEVHPVVTPALRGLTITVIVLGCTGMIYLTGAIVQFLTATQMQNLLGLKRMKSDIDRLTHHTIVCGSGRIGKLLARDLSAAGAPFVVIEREEDRVAQAREKGYLCVHGDATEEMTLVSAGVMRARSLATVLPNDAANVFITLSARSLNRELQIVARGEAPSTESKLLNAGASQVVLPAQIGAERIAEMILQPKGEQLVRDAEHMEGFGQGLHALGLNLGVVTVAEDSRYARQSIEEIERQAGGAFLVVAINRRDGTTISRPARDLRVLPGDGVVLIARGASASAQVAFGGSASAV